MTAVLRVAIFCAGAWTWLYTLPLEASGRADRRREVASDLWEFQADRAQASRLCSAVHVLVRVLLGIPDDLLWTCERIAVDGDAARVSLVIRLAIVAVAVGSVALAAGGPTFDATKGLKVTVEAAGWLRDSSPDPVSRAALAPTIALTLTNVGDQPTPALQVNAVFHRAAGGWDDIGLGTAYAPVVGWRGLAVGETSRRIVLQGLGAWVLDAGTGRRMAVPLTRIDRAGVRLFARHDGRWTQIGNFDIPARAMPR
jgi:hypothetical protein